jgi:hypothetical protein
VDKLHLTFTHPRSSEIYDAMVSPQCPAGVALDQLQADNATELGPFLEAPPPGRPYELVLARKGIVIPAALTMAAAGVVDGDVFEIRQSGQGADPACTPHLAEEGAHAAVA